MDLPLSPRRHRKLAAELNQEIFLSFKPATQRNFIWGLGWDFYAMFQQKLLTKTKRVCNPDQNHWKETAGAIVSRDGLNIHTISTHFRTHIFAEKGFAISGKHSRIDNFPGTIIYYYEVKLSSESYCRIGLSNGTPAEGELIGSYPNSYAIQASPHYDIANWCLLAGKMHVWKLPADDAIQPEPKQNGTNVYGCGLVMDPNDKLSIFFTLNGTFIGRQIPISPSVDEYEHLFPAVTLIWNLASIVTNFGNDKDKPLDYDIKECLGMELEWI